MAIRVSKSATSLVIACLIGLAAGCASLESHPLAEDDAAVLYPIPVGDRFGYINRACEVVVEPRFSVADTFVEGRGRVAVGGTREGQWCVEGAVCVADAKWGFVDNRGHMVIPARFDTVSEFSEGLAWFWNEDKHDNKKGYIDRAGYVVIEPMFDDADAFTEGRASVEVAEKWGYIDRKGRWVVEPTYDMAFDYSEGLASVKLGGMSGFVDQSGKLTIPLQFKSDLKTRSHVGGFSEGLAPVVIEEKLGYIDNDGSWAIPPQFYPNDPFRIDNSFHDGLACVWQGDEMFFIDHTGSRAIADKRIRKVEPFSNGYARVILHEPEDLEPDEELGPLTACIDTSGRIIMPPDDSGVYTCSDDLNLIANARGFGFMDRTGEIIIAPQFEEVEPFNHGLARVRIEDEWGYIDKTGKPVWGLKKFYGWHLISEIQLDVLTGSQEPETMYHATLHEDGRIEVKAPYFDYIMYRMPGNSPPDKLFQGNLYNGEFNRLARAIHVSGFFNWPEEFEPRGLWGGRPEPTIKVTVKRGEHSKSIRVRPKTPHAFVA